jgi:hypothetical protein
MIVYLVGNPDCPVDTLEKYLSKLHPDNPNIWQRPKNRIREGVDVWNGNSPIGKSTLYNFMVNVSRRVCPCDTQTIVFWQHT